MCLSDEQNAVAGMAEIMPAEESDLRKLRRFWASGMRGVSRELIAMTVNRAGEGLNLRLPAFSYVRLVIARASASF